MSECGRECGCGSPSRRELLKAGAAAAGVMIGTGLAKAAPGDIPPAAKVPPPKEWFEQLEAPGAPIVYRGEQLRNLIFPLGGIGTGTVWLRGSGRLVNWQIFNNIQKNTRVDDTFFAVRIEEEGKPAVVRALQQTAVGPLPGIEDVAFLGRYPVATLSLRDPALPVELELEAFNPLIPLNEKDSGIPCAIFVLRAVNRGEKAVRVSFLASLQNAVGHSGAGASRGRSHATYGGNINRGLREDGLTAVAMHAQPGKPAEIHPPIELVIDHQELPSMGESPVTGLALIGPGLPPNNADLRRVYWLAEGDLRQVGGALLSQIAAEVRQRGSLLLLSGVGNPLTAPVRATAADETRRERVFASFDSQSFGQWIAKGKAFRHPAGGTAPNQHPVTGFLGAGLVNSFDPDDHSKGSLTSPSFRIKEKYIALLVGGGEQPGNCAVNLRVDGKVVRSATGRNSERLERVEWEVADLHDRDAEIEIVDQATGGWGHVLADDIRFGNLPIDAITADEAEAWNALLDEVRSAPAMTPANVGKGRALLVPVELGRAKPGGDPLAQRDHVLQMIAALAGSTYRPATGRPENAPSFGTMCLATADPQASWKLEWTDRAELVSAWQQAGRLDESTAAPAALGNPTPPGETVNAALCVEASAPPGGEARAAFVLAWHFPHQYYPHTAWRPLGNTAVEVGTMYANWYQDAPSVARGVLRDLDRLRSRTLAFRDAVFDTTLPQYLVDAAAANASIIRGPSCFWTKAGTFYGYEGCNFDGGGCCPMNCNHVWNYEQALAKLWPGLEQNMRVTELRYHQQDNGGINHRVEVPRDNPDKRHFPVADGQCGAVLKAYREHLASPDRRFLDDHWPMIKKAIDFAIEEWDPNHDGVMEKPQFNTYDRVIYGHNTFVSSLYLAALRAAEEMARLCKEPAAAGRYRELFDKGSVAIARTLFDGEYYLQTADNLNLGYGKGCFADQVVGQWWARLLNLGDLLPVEQVRSALAAIFKHNMLWTQEGFQGTQRFLQFADGKDMGLLICTWPKGGRPEDPILYRDEIWTGVEYQVAAHKLYEGQLTEALAIVRAARGRYDGVKKSPWNEIECGDYYTRAMSSWSLLLAAQGYHHDGPARALAFNPRLRPDDHRSFFTSAQAWGRFEQHRQTTPPLQGGGGGGPPAGDPKSAISNRAPASAPSEEAALASPPSQGGARGGHQRSVLAFLDGRCDLSRLQFGLPAEAKSVRGTIKLEDRDLRAHIAAADGYAVVELNAPVTAQAGQTLAVTLDWSA